jgi:arsenite methyltransferase
MSDEVIDRVRAGYASVARGSLSGDMAGVQAIARAFGYSAEELAALPAEASMGLSCGNPTATANLRPGETVVDLGCGGGLDVLLAALKVGPTGRAIGIDMTPEMIDRARAAAARPVAGQVLRNVEFHLARIDALPLADSTVDCLISNCVLNLAPDKRAVFREMFRVLKPGGRVAVSDIALKKPLPADLVGDVGAYLGCVAGAVSFDEYERGLREAGFRAVQVFDARKDLNAYALLDGQAGCCSPAMSASSLPLADGCCTPATRSVVHEGLADLLRRCDLNEYAASVQVYALKAAC